MKEIIRDRIRTTGSLSLLALSNQFNVDHIGFRQQWNEQRTPTGARMNSETSTLPHFNCFSSRDWSK